MLIINYQWGYGISPCRAIKYKKRNPHKISECHVVKMVIVLCTTHWFIHIDSPKRIRLETIFLPQCSFSYNISTIDSGYNELSVMVWTKFVVPWKRLSPQYKIIRLYWTPVIIIHFRRSLGSSLKPESTVVTRNLFHYWFKLRPRSCTKIVDEKNWNIFPWSIKWWSKIEKSSWFQNQGGDSISAYFCVWLTS